MQGNRRAYPNGNVPPSRPPDAAPPEQEPAPAPKTRFYSGYTRIRTLESFQHRDFRMLWIAILCMSAGMWAINITTGWLTYELTASPLLTGLAIGMGTIPPVIVAPIAGVLTDSLDRRMVMIAAIASFAIFVAAFGCVVILGALQTWHIFAMSFMAGVSGSFLIPAEQALIANVVPKRRLVNAFALSGFAISVTRLAAPAMTGFVIAFIGAGGAVMLASAFASIAIFFAMGLRVPKKDYWHPIQPKAVWADLVEAAYYVKQSKIVLAMTVLTATLLMFVSTVNMGLMPVFASDVFDQGPEVLGLLVAALGGGMTIGTILLASIGNSERRGRLVILTAALTAVGIMAFSHIGSLTLGFPILMFYGATMAMTWMVTSALIQSVVPDNLRGRVSALTVTTHAVFPLGTLLVGTLAEMLGAPAATLVSGSITLVIVLAIPIAFRGIWSLRTGAEADDPAPDTEPVTSTDALEPHPA